MNKIAIFADSCSSLTLEEAKELGVTIIPTIFTMDGVDYNPLDKNILSYDEFYKKLENKVFCKTASVNPNTFITYFEKALLEKKDIIYISLSSGLSSSYNNAFLAKNLLEEDYDNNIELIDSLTGSIGIQIIIKKACELRNQGHSAQEIKEQLDQNKLNIKSLFTIGSLDHLKRGGRISTVTALIGKLIKMFPIISTNSEGKLVSDSIFRGKIKALQKMIEEVIANIKENVELYIGYTNNKEECEYVKDSLSQKVKNIITRRIDYTMGSHCGPGTLAVFFISK